MADQVKLCPLAVAEDGTLLPCDRACAWLVADGGDHDCAVAVAGRAIRRVSGAAKAICEAQGRKRYNAR